LKPGPTITVPFHLLSRKADTKRWTSTRVIDYLLDRGISG